MAWKKHVGNLDEFEDRAWGSTDEDTHTRWQKAPHIPAAPTSSHQAILKASRRVAPAFRFLAADLQVLEPHGDFDDVLVPFVELLKAFGKRLLPSPTSGAAKNLERNPEMFELAGLLGILAAGRSRAAAPANTQTPIEAPRPRVDPWHAEPAADPWNTSCNNEGKSKHKKVNPLRGKSLCSSTTERSTNTEIVPPVALTSVATQGDLMPEQQDMASQWEPRQLPDYDDMVLKCQKILDDTLGYAEQPLSRVDLRSKVDFLLAHGETVASISEKCTQHDARINDTRIGDTLQRECGEKWHMVGDHGRTFTTESNLLRITNVHAGGGRASARCPATQRYGDIHLVECLYKIEHKT